MIRTVLDMRVRPGRAEEFERTWREAAVVTARYPGSLGQTMLRAPGDPLQYTITADWSSREELARYQTSEDREALSAALDLLRESAAKALYEVVAHVAPGSSAPAPPDPAQQRGTA